ncbi:hypothetical protein [Tsukamurella paurometabola]|uniref:hypothetical protein n=1 Tax=Tsukamurella paurometabola TaxID=2061 RepID=UPI0011C04108|nr:hypothetical protein [Tsukamurella paurometabola]
MSLLVVAAGAQLVRFVALCPQGFSGIRASHLGAALAYVVLAVTIAAGERWGYLAAAGYPPIGELLGDHWGMSLRDSPFLIAGIVVDLLIVLTALFLWRTTTAARRR